jgi:hypothetical protein
MWPSGVGLFNDSNLLTNLVEFQGLKMQFMANRGAVRRYSLHLSARSRKTTILIGKTRIWYSITYDFTLTLARGMLTRVMLTSEWKIKGVNMKLSKIIVAGLAVLSCGCLVQSVNAIPTLTLSDGTTTIVVTDGSAMDSSPLAGAVLFNGAVGSNFFLNVSTGVTKPLSGSASAPSMDLNSVNLATGAGTLTITFSETGFTAFPGILTGDVGGTVALGGSFTNIVMQNALNLVTNGPFAPLPIGFSGSGSAALIDGAPYSLTQTAILTFGPGGGMTSFNAAATVVPSVPDGGMTVTMLGIGLLTVGAARRIYRRATV